LKQLRDYITILHFFFFLRILSLYLEIKDYLLDAAQQIRMALDREVNEDYEAAFSYYKNGVDLLLNGVQVDPNKERREAVKRKTTQYLKRAEEIFISYLQDNIAKGSTHLGGYSSLRFRSIRHLSSPVEDLAMCKVIGIIDKVCVKYPLLSGSSWLSLPKSSWESRERSTIIPQGVPFMVKLLKYYVSEDTVFLHLEHVQGELIQAISVALSHCILFQSSLTESKTKSDNTVREHPECFSPNQNKIYLKNSYTLPALRQEIYLNEHYGRTKPLESPGSPTKQCLENCTTHSYCEDSGRQQGGSLGLYATRTDNELPSVGLPNGLKSLPQDNIPLPIHPCVIVDTRDPLDWGRWGLPENEVRLWGAQILLALESLHEQGIVCQDLNPRNILLCNSGEACLTYFGLWTEVQPEINPKAMEEMYCAPEIGGASKITEACDWWSLGALLYELLTGTPLWQCHPTGIHPHTPLHIPEFLSAAAASLLTELLQFDACYRLGSGGGGVSDIKCHPFFNSIPWLTLTSLVGV
uniref:Ribosomal protein S6 kinase-like 1 n=1 Tax=Sinocyclocheilus rhinocerous TaxID=307959 RepID=A0A673I003_9TELE